MYCLSLSSIWSPSSVKSPWFYLRSPVLFHSVVPLAILPRSRGGPVSQDDRRALSHRDGLFGAPEIQVALERV